MKKMYFKSIIAWSMIVVGLATTVAGCVASFKCEISGTVAACVGICVLASGLQWQDILDAKK